jgi:predicted nucleic acid-binding protein
MGLNYFFDSYAIIEIVKENPKYEPYRNELAVLTIFNLAEIYWSALLDYTEEKAELIFQTYKNAVVEVDDETLKEAILFRKEHKKRNLSYTDCIGYIYAKRNNLNFLTGDMQFEKMPFVEFVK